MIIIFNLDFLENRDFQSKNLLHSFVVSFCPILPISPRNPLLGTTYEKSRKN